MKISRNGVLRAAGFDPERNAILDQQRYDAEVAALTALVDGFAARMKRRLLEKLAKGYRGWDDESITPNDKLLEMLSNHLGNQEGDETDLIDVANVTAMIWNRLG